MSNDPYAAATDFQDYHEDGPPKTSVLAILSLVCSLICFIPGLSALGSLLGVFGLIRITTSNGRIKGMGLAVAGIAIGVIVSVIWFVIAFGVQKGIQQYTAFGQVISDIDSDSYDSARGMLTRESRTLATDELMAEFKAAYQADAGSIKEWPKGLTGVFGTFMDLGKQGQQPDNSQVPYPSSMPLPGMFDSGNRIVWVIIDQQGQLGETGNLPAIINVAVQASDGSLIWLIDPDVQRAGAQLVPSGGETETPEGDAAPEQVSPADDDGEG